MRGKAVEVMGAFHARQGGTAEACDYAEWGLIASICMICGDVYRVRGAEGGEGGLSHGWCSAACAEVGADQAEIAALPSQPMTERTRPQPGCRCDHQQEDEGQKRKARAVAG